MSTITITRAATADEMGAEIDRRGAVIERLETDLRHWREECGKLHARIDGFSAEKFTAELMLALGESNHKIARWSQGAEPFSYYTREEIEHAVGVVLGLKD